MPSRNALLLNAPALDTERVTALLGDWARPAEVGDFAAALSSIAAAEIDVLFFSAGLLDAVPDAVTQLRAAAHRVILIGQPRNPNDADRLMAAGVDLPLPESATDGRFVPRLDRLLEVRGRQTPSIGADEVVRTTLVVSEDPSVLLSGVHSGLSNAGFQVLTTATATAALQRLRHDPIDIAFVDTGSSDIAVDRLIEAMHAFDPRLPVVLMVPAGRPDMAAMVPKWGGVDFLIKPIGIRQTLAVALRAVARLDKAAGDPQAVSAMHILAIGDSHDTRAQVEAQLDGLQCVWVESVSEAVAYVAALHPDLPDLVVNTPYSDTDDSPAVQRKLPARPLRPLVARWSEGRLAATDGDWGLIEPITNLVAVIRRHHFALRRTIFEDEILSARRHLENGNIYLRQLDATRTSLISDVSHELRNPLSALQASLSLVHTGRAGELNADQTKLLGAGVRNCTRLDRLLTDLREISRYEAGQIELKVRALSLANVVEHAVGALTIEADEKKITLLHDVSPGMPELVADPLRLEQVFINLLSNAIKYTPAGGRVMVEAEMNRVDGQSLHEVRVSDTGVGIDNAHLERLFQPFYRVAGAQPAAPGSGLGLTITRNLVKLHRGEIRVASRVGRGTTFTVRLPTLSEDDIALLDLGNAVRNAKRSLTNVSLLMLRLPDAVGEERGRRMLSHLLERVKSQRRDSDSTQVMPAARSGFVILPATDAAGAAVAFSRCRKLLRAGGPPSETSAALDVMLSVATYPENGVTVAELLSVAEKSGQTLKTRVPSLP